MLKSDKRKIVYILAPILVLAVSIAIWVVNANRSAGSSLRPNVKLSQQYSTYAELIEDSPIIVTGNVVSYNNEFMYDDMTFSVTEVMVSDCVRGDVQAHRIRILQKKSEYDPYLVKDTDVLLFLSEYSGPIANDVYVINGLQNGQYEIKNGQLYEAGIANKAAPIMKHALLSDVLSDIKNSIYHYTEQPALSADEVEKANEAEKALEAQKANEAGKQD